MITLIKGEYTKVLEENSGLIAILITQGWTEEPKKKEVKNGKSSSSGN